MSRCVSCNSVLRVVPDPLDMREDCLCNRCRAISRDLSPMRSYQFEQITESLMSYISYDDYQENGIDK